MTHNIMPNEIVSADDLFSAHRDESAPVGPVDEPNEAYDLPPFLRYSSTELKERLPHEPIGSVSNENKYDIPPFLRLPPIGSKERLEMTLSAMNRRFLWLAERGIRPSSSAIEHRAAIAKQLEILSQSAEKVGASGTAVDAAASGVP